MKHLGLFFAFIGVTMLLFMVPKLTDHELGTDSKAADQAQARLDRLEQALEERTQHLTTALEGLVRRLESLKSRLERQPLAIPSSPPATKPPLASQATDADSPGGQQVSPAEFKALLPKVLRSALDGTATAEEQQRFWQAARTTCLVDNTIKSLEALVQENPQATEARMELADAYVAKLLTVPAGPERGIWGMKAEKQWKDVVRQDPDHWDAQYTLAFSYSMYPDFLNKTDAAIQGFERALGIQERLQPKSRHAKTYVQLARMHKKKGDAKKAREVLELGQVRHPRDKQITAALQAFERK